MKFNKQIIALSVAALTILGTGATAFAASNYATNVESSFEKASSIVLGKDAQKEPDGVAKVSFDMGKTWINQNDIAYSENLSTEFWPYEEYEAYANAVEKDLAEMLTTNEPNLTKEDVEAWKSEALQMLDLIKAGGKISKNIFDNDSELVISSDSTAIEIQKEKK